MSIACTFCSLVIGWCRRALRFCGGFLGSRRRVQTGGEGGRVLRAKAFPRARSIQQAPLQDLVGDETCPLVVIELSPDFVKALVEAYHPTELHELFPRPLFQRYLSHPHLRYLHPLWTPEAVAVRALRAGVVASRILSGVGLKSECQDFPYPNSIFVVLRSRAPPGSWVCHSEEFLRQRLSIDGLWDTSAVFHGFASSIEAELYLRGAGWEAWPLVVRADL